MAKIVFVIMFISSMVKAKNDIVYGEPELVELAGVLDLQTFAGPPDYESIKDGDSVEKYFFLKLSKPVDFIPNRSSAKTLCRKNIRILQLVVRGSDDYVKLRKMGEGAFAKIKGTLFEAINGHHRSRVLLQISEMAPDFR